MDIKNYQTYDDYISHQKSKLDRNYSTIVLADMQYEKTVYGRYVNRYNFEGKSVLCLGARLGGEVRAFKTLGALAIGIDLNPYEKSIDVLHGDFHAIQFPDGVFDFVFTNCIDHVLLFDQFFSEVHRVIKSGGIFLCELAIQKAGAYETIDTRDVKELKGKISIYFSIKNTVDIDNKWKGELLILSKHE